MNIGVYVGSFNPVHLGHKKVINYLLDNNIVDKIIVIVTNNYWNKKINTSLEDRINMLKFYENERIIIDEKLNNIEYTYEILDELNKIYNNDNLNLIIGADNIINFDKWKNVDKILNNNNVIVLKRNNIDINKYINKFKTNRFIICNFDEIDISSTKIRKLLSEKNYKEVSNYLDCDIISYIKNNNLY